jgi:hypothetical protein
MEVLGAWFLILIVAAVLWAFFRLLELTFQALSYWRASRD